LSLALRFVGMQEGVGLLWMSPVLDSVKWHLLRRLLCLAGMQHHCQPATVFKSPWLGCCDE
jgi:hypothetical protein